MIHYFLEESPSSDKILNYQYVQLKISLRVSSTSLETYKSSSRAWRGPPLAPGHRLRLRLQLRSTSVYTPRKCNLQICKHGLVKVRRASLRIDSSLTSHPSNRSRRSTTDRRSSPFFGARIWFESIKTLMLSENALSSVLSYHRDAYIFVCTTRMVSCNWYCRLRKKNIYVVVRFDFNKSRHALYRTVIYTVSQDLIDPKISMGTSSCRDPLLQTCKEVLSSWNRTT